MALSPGRADSVATPAAPGGVAAPTHLSRIPVAAWWILALMTVDNVLGVIDRNAVSILKTTLKSEFRVGDVEYGWLVTAFMVPYAIFYVIMGRVVDRWGSRGPLTAFVVVWSTATVASGLAGSFPELVAWRMVLGAAEAGLLPATIYALVCWFPRDRLATVYAIKTPLQSLGPILSAPVIAALALAYGWRSAFLVPGMLGFVFALLWWVSDRHPPAYDEPAAPRTGGAGLRDLLAMPQIWGIMIARLITDPVWFFFQYWQAGYLQERLGASLGDVGALLWIPPLATSLLTFATAAASDRLRAAGRGAVASRVRIMQAVAILSIAVLLVPLVSSPTVFVMLSAITYFMSFTWLYLSNVLVADLFPKQLVGSAIGLVNCVGTVGAAIVNAGVGAAIVLFGYPPVFLALGLLVPIGAVWLQIAYRSDLAARAA